LKEQFSFILKTYITIKPIYDVDYCCPGLFCNKIGAVTHFQASGAENNF